MIPLSNQNINECFQEPVDERCLWVPGSSKPALPHDGELKWRLLLASLVTNMIWEKRRFCIFLLNIKLENPISYTYEYFNEN